MKWIRNWRDLNDFGVDLLTGEACGLCYRLLCDVTANGKHIVEKCFGGIEIRFTEPWNSGNKDDPHIGSILVPPELFIPLGAFALLESGCNDVWQVGDSLMGFEPSDSEEQRVTYESIYGPNRKRRFRYLGTAGDRNVHQMTGRVT